MNNSIKGIRFIYLSGVLLLIGFLNYFLLETGVINSYGVTGFLQMSMRFSENHLSDLLWCTALYCSLVFLRKSALVPAPVHLALLLLPFATEGLQFIRVIGGTADAWDVIIYAVVLLLFLTLYPQQILFSIKWKQQPVLGMAVFGFYLLLAAASVAPKSTYQPKPNPCITHAPISGSPLLIRIYISGNYTMKDLPGAQTSGRDLFLQSLNNFSYGKYKLADGVNAPVTFNITFNEYSGYYGAEVYMNVSDGLCKSNGKYLSFCSAFKRFETSYVTAGKLFDDIAERFNSFITGGWCTDCPSPCNPYGMESQPVKKK